MSESKKEQTEDNDNDTALDCVETTKPKAYPFTIYTKKEKYVLMMLLAVIGLWSTVSSPIYFPAVPTISEKFDITRAVADLSIVSYLLAQGIMPAFSSNFADNFGRRPVIIAGTLIYIASCIALSRTNVYWLLATLRCVQAAGIGPIIAISSGVSGDVCTAADRGGFVGLVSGLQLTGNAFGGLIGAGLIHSFGWRGIFVFLAIGSGVTLCFIVLLLPETLRSFVGNGSVSPKRFINVAPIFLLNHYKKRLTNDVETLGQKSKIDLFSSFKMLVHKEIICVLLSPALKFAIWTMALTSLTLLEEDGYNYTVLEVGYIYLPQGVACLLGSIISGRILNWSYRMFKKRHDTQFADLPEEEKPKFNVLKSRIYTAILPCILHFIGTLIYGWCLHFKQNISSIIISTCLISYASTSFISIATTILVDLHPSNASTSASLMNLARCCLAALCTGILSKMSKAMGLGGCYTFWACIGLSSDFLLLLAIKMSKHKVTSK